MNMPFTAQLLQSFVGMHGALSAGAPDRQLHRHNRHAHAEQEDQIEKNEQAAAILSYYIWETPYVTDTNGAPRTDQDKSQS